MSLRQNLKRKAPEGDVQPYSTPDPLFWKQQSLGYLSRLEKSLQVIRDAIVNFYHMQEVIDAAYDSYGFLVDKNRKTMKREQTEKGCIQVNAQLGPMKDSLTKRIFIEVEKKHAEAKSEALQVKDTRTYQKYKTINLCGAIALCDIYYIVNERKNVDAKLAIDDLRKQLDVIENALPSNLNPDEVSIPSVLQEVINVLRTASTEIEIAYRTLRDLRNIQLSVGYTYFLCLFNSNRTKSAEESQTFIKFCENLNIPALFEQLLKNSKDQDYINAMQKNKYAVYNNFVILKVKYAYDENLKHLRKSYESLVGIFKNTKKYINGNTLSAGSGAASESKEPAEKKPRISNEAGIQTHVGFYFNFQTPHQITLVCDPNIHYKLLETNHLLPILFGAPNRSAGPCAPAQPVALGAAAETKTPQIPLTNHDLIWINDEEFSAILSKARTDLSEEKRNPMNILNSLFNAQAPAPHQIRKLFTPTNYMTYECWWNSTLLSLKGSPDQFRLDLIDEKTQQMILQIMPAKDGTLNIKKGKVNPNNKMDLLIELFGRLLCAKNKAVEMPAAVLSLSASGAGSGAGVSMMNPAIPIPNSLPMMPGFTRAEFLNRIRACAGKNIATWLPSVFGMPYQVTKTTCVWPWLEVDYPNGRNEKQPFKIRLQIEGSDEFIIQKERGDKNGQSWVFNNEQDIRVFTEGQYVPQPKIGDLPRFLIVRGWQINDSKAQVKAGENEILRSWFTSCQQIAEMKDVAKGTLPANPIPGVCVLGVNQDLFSLFKPRKIVYADASYKRPGVFARVWNAIKSSKNYYQDQTIFSEGSYPLKVSLFEHKHPGHKDQQAEIHQYCLGKIQSYPLFKFFEILNSTQQKKLVEIYKVCVENIQLEGKMSLGTRGKSKNKVDFQLNPYDMTYSSNNYFKNNNFNLTLQDLVKAVDEFIKKNPNCSYDADMHGLICDGVDTTQENSASEAFKAKSARNFASSEFVMWVYGIIWGGYYWQLTPCESPKDSKDAKDEPSAAAACR